MEEDRRLVAGVIARDPQALREFVDRHQRLIAHIVCGAVSDASDREELVQEVFLRALAGLSSFRFGSKLSTWLGVIAFNTSINHRSRSFVRAAEGAWSRGVPADSVAEDDAHSDPSRPAEHPSPEAALEKKELCDDVRAEVERLPPQYRAPIVLFHLDDMTYAEIGQIMGISLENVKIRLHRGRRLLKERLSQRYRPEDT